MDSVLHASGSIVLIVLQMIQLVVIASVIVSWVGADPNNTIVRTIVAITEPMFAPIRKLTSRIPGPLDWAPLILLLAIVFLMKLVSNLMVTQRGMMGP